GFGKALQARDILESLGLGDEAALAVNAENKAFLLQIAERLAHGDAADTEDGAELRLRWHAAVRRIAAVENVRTQLLADLAVQGRSIGRQQRRQGGEFSQGHVLFSLL